MDARKLSELLRAELLTPVYHAAARQRSPTANEPPRDKLPVDAQRMRTWALSQVKHYATSVKRVARKRQGGMFRCVAMEERAWPENPF